MKEKKTIASIITGVMTTWTFIIVFLAVCVFEIWFNHSTLIPEKFQFDPTMLGLNLCLSLIAAIQGSIIMIAQKQADELRDATLQHSLKLDKRQVQYDEHQIKLEEEIIRRLEVIEKRLKDNMKKEEV